MGVGTRDATPLRQRDLAVAARALAEGTLRQEHDQILANLAFLGGLGDFSPGRSD